MIFCEELGVILLYRLDHNPTHSNPED